MNQKELIRTFIFGLHGLNHQIELRVKSEKQTQLKFMFMLQI